MQFGLFALVAAGVGAGGAALADTKYPDKTVTIPYVDVTLPPGAIISALGIGLGLLAGAPALLALGLGSGLYEGGTRIASQLLPDGGGGGALPPGTPAAVAGLGYGPPLRGFDCIDDSEVVEAIANMERG